MENKGKRWNTVTSASSENRSVPGGPSIKRLLHIKKAWKKGTLGAKSTTIEAFQTLQQTKVQAGAWRWSCRYLNSVNGGLLSEDKYQTATASTAIAELSSTPRPIPFTTEAANLSTHSYNSNHKSVNQNQNQKEKNRRKNEYNTKTQEKKLLTVNKRPPVI